MISTLAIYNKTARHIAHTNQRSVWDVFARMAYARLVGFGPRFFVLYDMLHKPLKHYRRYIQNDDLDVLQAQMNGLDGRRFADDKLAFYLRCRGHGLATPRIFALIGGDGPGSVETPLPNIERAKQLKSCLALSGMRRFVLKPTVGSHGAGVHIISFDGTRIKDPCGTVLNPSDLLASIGKTGTPYLVQEAVTPHPDLASVMPGEGMGTVRIITVLDGDHVSVRHACVRLPARGALTDNFVDGTAGNLLANIEIVSGRLGRTLGPGLAPPGVEWVEPVDRHPDTGMWLDGFVMPQWNDVLKLAKKAARAFGDLNTVGWDIAVGPGGPTLLEANWSYGAVTLQAASGRGLKDEFESMASETKMPSAASNRYAGYSE